MSPSLALNGEGLKHCFINVDDMSSQTLELCKLGITDLSLSVNLSFFLVAEIIVCFQRFESDFVHLIEKPQNFAFDSCLGVRSMEKDASHLMGGLLILLLSIQTGSFSIF